MNTPTDWTWHKEPPCLGWYAILECWEPEEGMFPVATLVQSLPLTGSRASGLVAHAGPFPTREAAEAWAQAHDPDGTIFVGTTTPHGAPCNMTPRQAAAMARLSSFVDIYTKVRGADPEYVHSVHAGGGRRSEHIRLSDLRTLLAMVSTTPTPGDPEQ